MTPRDLNVFVAPTGNAFMRDIAAWFVEAGAQLGRSSLLCDDGSPPTDADAINLVVAPHEYYLLSDFDDRTIHRAAQISVPVCTEQPGTPWFDIGAITAATAPLAFDINAHGVDALQRRGVDTRFSRLGGVPSMNIATRERIERDVEVVFLGGNTLRRAERLSELAPALWHRDTDLRLFSFFTPVHGGVPGLVFGDDKYRLLARSQILLNIHRDDKRPGYFEWARMVEAMANGCCVVTEPVDGFAPFVPGEHFISTDDLAGEITRLLDDPAELRRIGNAAQQAVLERFPLSANLAPLLDELDSMPALAVDTSSSPPKYRRHMIVAQQHPVLPPFKTNGALRKQAYEAMMAETDLQRQIQRLRSRLAHGVEDHEVRTESVAYASATPTVSVIVTLYNYADLVIETLDSIVASTDIDFEIVIIDDHSTDRGRDAVKRFIDAHPDTAIMLIGSDINRGLAAARNIGIGAARADKVMVMDADNLVYPTALRKLSDALDDDPGAAFAYATLEMFGTRTGVLSAMSWYPPWLCESNYIDAQAMFRSSTWERHDGYREGDNLVFGWEDWELWLRLADAGERGVHVTQMLGRYRTQEASMISVSNLVADHMIAHLHELYPNLPWPAPPS